jgi:hypothetical protein
VEMQANLRNGFQALWFTGSVLSKAGYSVFRQRIPKLIYFLLPKITFVAD